MSKQTQTTNASTTSPTPQTTPIPRLTSVAPAIFVPLKTNLLEPFTPPSTPGDALKAQIAAVDAHSPAVRANIIALFRRECLRIERDYKAQEDAFRAENPDVSLDPRKPAGLLPPDELEFLLARLLARHDPARDYNLPDAVIPWPTLPIQVSDTPRERAAKEIMELISRAMIDLKGFDGHVVQIKDDYRQAYETEVKKRFQ